MITGVGSGSFCFRDSLYKSGHSCVLDHFFLLESVSRLHHSIRGGVGVDLRQFGTGPPGGNGGWGGILCQRDASVYLAGLSRLCGERRLFEARRKDGR